MLRKTTLACNRQLAVDNLQSTLASMTEVPSVFLWECSLIFRTLIFRALCSLERGRECLEYESSRLGYSSLTRVDIMHVKRVEEIMLARSTRSYYGGAEEMRTGDWGEASRDGFRDTVQRILRYNASLNSQPCSEDARALPCSETYILNSDKRTKKTNLCVISRSLERAAR